MFAKSRQSEDGVYTQLVRLHYLAKLETEITAQSVQPSVLCTEQSAFMATAMHGNRCHGDYEFLLMYRGKLMNTVNEKFH